MARAGEQLESGRYHWGFHREHCPRPRTGLKRPKSWAEEGWKLHGGAERTEKLTSDVMFVASSSAWQPPCSSAPELPSPGHEASSSAPWGRWRPNPGRRRWGPLDLQTGWGFRQPGWRGEVKRLRHEVGSLVQNCHSILAAQISFIQ